MNYTPDNFYVELNVPNTVPGEILKSDIDKLFAMQKEFNYAHPFLRGDQITIPQSTLEIFDLVGLTIHPRKCLFFMVPPRTNGPLHTDGHKDFNNERSFGLNWIWEEADSVMEWYEPVKPPTYKKLATGLELYHYKLEDCELIHSHCVTGVNLINVEKPHLVKNFKTGPRFCLSMCPEEKLSYAEAIELFKSKGLIKN